MAYDNKPDGSRTPPDGSNYYKHLQTSNVDGLTDKTTPGTSSKDGAPSLRHAIIPQFHHSTLAPSRLAFSLRFSTSLEMGLPSQPVTLSVEQLGELNRQLATMRHDINNNLSLIVAAAELMRHKPAVAERMMNTLAEQPGKITAGINKFTAPFEPAFGITRP